MEKINFSYESVGNFCKLLTTILYEQSHTPREITVFHQRFDSAKNDELFETFLTELWPEGITIGEEELKVLLAHVERFMLKDQTTLDLFARYDKRRYNYYIYFKPDNIVYECKFAEHATMIKDICCDFFEGFSEEEILKVNMKRFILDNFEIKSDNSTIEQIANYSEFIRRSIVLKDRRIKNEVI